ncbi:MAG: selenocysteine-specific translation elongation factor [Rhodospirillaceae bacterium]|jgi:selenocysteine-specific elongation factor|nr:selenocysteine-specific translation elongation factor [Rhodospirillaceae bacterium]MBT5459554.1 selenocysteine-specific translation elongation factor [Rhodospirillaceae bacterium]
MIIATSGHIDHGKTVLVKALTGVDTDRLPEEKKRGISIDLGYAYSPLDGEEVLGFVDVPGHERFVRNMLAGVTGIDYALLVVAADDGPMPQTEEHLAILDLLGLTKGAIALTKIDRVDPDRVAEVGELMELLLDSTALEGAPIFPVSGVTGDGVPALRAHLQTVAREFANDEAGGQFRLAIDRRFTVPGAGLVVTGTVFSGRVAVDDRLIVSPSGLAARVRGIHAQNQESGFGQVGQRCALNIAGPDLSKDHVHRGDWIVAAPVHAPTKRLDARIRLLRSEPRPLKHWTPVHLHLGAVDVSARVAVLGDRQIAPGESALVQLVLDQPIGALRDDRLILRDQSATRTMAGGRVLDPFAPARGRARPERLENIAAMEIDDPADSLGRLLDLSPNGVDLSRFTVTRNLGPDEAAVLFDHVPMARVGRAGEETGIAPPRWGALAEEALAALARFHEKSPDRFGPAENALRLSFEKPPPPVLFGELIAALATEGRLVSANKQLRLPGHQAVMADKDKQLWARVEPALVAGGLQPPAVHDLAADLGVAPDPLFGFLRRAAAQGLVVHIGKNRFLPPAAVRELGEIAESLALTAEDGMITAAAFRGESGIGRNLAIEILEHFDQAGLTRRIGDARRILKTAEEIFGGPV